MTPNPYRPDAMWLAKERAATTEHLRSLVKRLTEERNAGYRVRVRVVDALEKVIYDQEHDSAPDGRVHLDPALRVPPGGYIEIMGVAAVRSRDSA